MNRSIYTKEELPIISIIGISESDTGQLGATTVNHIYRSGNAIISSIFDKNEDLVKKLIFFQNIESTLISNNIQELKNDKDSKIVVIIDMDVDFACEAIIRAISLSKNVINLNSEVEILFGMEFQKIAHASNVIYTFGAGDEPQTALELIQFARQLGFKVIAAGKGKNNPLNRLAKPNDFIEVSKKTGVSAKAYTSFVDGTKTMIEMALLANMAGMTIDKAGMHGVEINKSQIVEKFKLKSEGGIINQEGIIDFVIGDLAPGVFVVIKCDTDSVARELEYLKVGSGPTFLLYRPFHLGILETLKCIYHIHNFGAPLVTYENNKMANVAGIAKKDIMPGTRFSGIGSELFYGYTFTEKDMKKGRFVPISLLNRTKAISNILKDNIITFDHVKIDKSSLTFRLWDFFENISEKQIQEKYCLDTILKILD